HREAMTHLVVAEERGLEVRGGAVGWRIRRIYRLMDRAHSEDFLVPVDQALQVPGKQPNVLQRRVNHGFGIEHDLFPSFVSRGTYRSSGISAAESSELVVKPSALRAACVSRWR